MTQPHNPSAYVFPLLMPMTVDEVFDKIYGATGITKQGICSKNRQTSIRQARQMFSAYCISKLKMESTVVGRIISCDHSTCLHSVKVVAQEVETGSDFGLLYKKIFNL